MSANGKAENKNACKSLKFTGIDIFFSTFRRVDWIRTSDPLHPIQVRYRAAPPPEKFLVSSALFPRLGGTPLPEKGNVSSRFSCYKALCTFFLRWGCKCNVKI
jgi:hypothetical protein